MTRKYSLLTEGVKKNNKKRTWAAPSVPQIAPILSKENLQTCKSKPEGVKKKYRSILYFYYSSLVIKNLAHHLCKKKERRDIFFCQNHNALPI